MAQRIRPVLHVDLDHVLGVLTPFLQTVRQTHLLRKRLRTMLEHVISLMPMLRGLVNIVSTYESPFLDHN